MEPTIFEVYELLSAVSNTVDEMQADTSLSDYYSLQTDGEINTDSEQLLSDIQQQFNEISVYDPEAEETTALTLFFDKLDTIHNDLLQIDACLKIFFVIACIVIFSKIFITTFFKGW